MSATKDEALSLHNHNSAEHGSKVLRVDGSFGEGGGQIIRNGVTLACILKKKIQVVNIRANRPNPGLASQHLESILAILRMSGASTPNTLKRGLQEFELNASSDEESLGKMSNTINNNLETTIDLKTAGSVTLCIQCILPYIFSAILKTKITIVGGTHVMKAPNVDYFQRVFVPIMNKIGYNFNITMLTPGYYPRGGGKVILSTSSETNSKFYPFKLTERGSLVEKSAILSLTPPLFKDKHLFMSKMTSMKDENITVKNIKIASVEYFLKYENTILGINRLIEGKPPRPTAEEVMDAIQSVEDEFAEVFESTVCVDKFLQDQLIIYMALSKLQNPETTSEFTTSAPLTDHTLSAIHVSQLFTGFKFKVEISDKIAHISL